MDVPCNSTSKYVPEAISIAGRAKYVIVVAGLDFSQETEDHHRYSLYFTKLSNGSDNACSCCKHKNQLF